MWRLHIVYTKWKSENFEYTWLPNSAESFESVRGGREIIGGGEVGKCDVEWGDNIWFEIVMDGATCEKWGESRERGGLHGELISLIERFEKICILRR